MHSSSCAPAVTGWMHVQVFTQPQSKKLKTPEQYLFPNITWLLPTFDIFLYTQQRLWSIDTVPARSLVCVYLLRAAGGAGERLLMPGTGFLTVGAASTLAFCQVLREEYPEVPCKLNQVRLLPRDRKAEHQS